MIVRLYNRRVPPTPFLFSEATMKPATAWKKVEEAARKVEVAARQVDEAGRLLQEATTRLISGSGVPTAEARQARQEAEGHFDKAVVKVMKARERHAVARALAVKVEEEDHNRSLYRE